MDLYYASRGFEVLAGCSSMGVKTRERDLLAKPEMQPVLTSSAGSDDTRTTVDFIIGFTQVVSRTSYFQVNYTCGSSSGYHNDYNNVLTVLDPNTGEPLVGGWLGQNDN